jgi:hypothetical protein
MNGSNPGGRDLERGGICPEICPPFEPVEFLPSFEPVEFLLPFDPVEL